MTDEMRKTLEEKKDHAIKMADKRASEGDFNGANYWLNIAEGTLAFLIKNT